MKKNKITFISVLAIMMMGILSVESVQAQYNGLGLESLKSDQLKQYAPPALNAAMTNKLKKMFDVSSPGMGFLNRTKKTLYFTWKVTGIPQIWKVDGPLKFPQQLTSGSDAVALKAVAPNDEYLIFSKDKDGQENPGLYLLDAQSGAVSEVYQKTKTQVSFSFVTDDSQWIYFSANDVKADSYNTYKYNVKTKTKELVFEGDGNWFIADQKNNGQLLLMVKLTGSRSAEYYEYNTETKNMIPVIGQGEKNEYEVSFTKENGKYFVLTPKENFKKIYLFDPKKSKDLKLIIGERLNYDINSFSLDKKRNRLIYEVNREGYTELRAIDATSLKNIDLPQFKGADHVFAGSTTDDGRVTMLGIVSAQSPRLSYSYDWSTRKLTQWVMPSAPEVDLKRFVVSRLEYYVTRDQVKIPMFVRIPLGCEKRNCPVVVHFHGGPEGQSQPGFNVVAQAFVDEGFIFVEPNVRGSDGYGKDWIDLDNGPRRENVITDIEDAASWIKQNWKKDDGTSVDVGVMGWSYGGYSTLMAMSRFAGAYKAGVALVGMSNLVTFLQNTAPYRRVLRISEYGDPDKDKEALLKLSPITYVDQVRDPLLIIQGANDPRVPVGEALQFHETLQRKKIPSQLIIFADEGHGSAKKENQILEIGHTIEFFKKHLKK